MFILDSKLTLVSNAIDFYLQRVRFSVPIAEPEYSIQLTKFRNKRSFGEYSNFFEAKEILYNGKKEVESSPHLDTFTEGPRLNLLATIISSIDFYESVESKFSHELFLAHKIFMLFKNINQSYPDPSNSSLFYAHYLMNATEALKNQLNTFIQDKSNASFDYSELDRIYDYVVKNYKVHNYTKNELDRTFLELETARVIGSK